VPFRSSGVIVEAEEVRLRGPLRVQRIRRTSVLRLGEGFCGAEKGSIHPYSRRHLQGKVGAEGCWSEA